MYSYGKLLVSSLKPSIGDLRRIRPSVMLFAHASTRPYAEEKEKECNGADKDGSQYTGEKSGKLSV